MDKIACIKELREKTLAGMADCKAALEESSYNFDAALDLVKARGLNNTSQLDGKTASEGRIVVHMTSDNTVGTMVEINSQTDFISGSPAFIAFAETAGSILGKTDLASFSGNLGILSVNETRSLEDARKELMASSKENIVVRRWMREETFSETARIFSYLHSNHKLAVLLSMSAPNKEAVSNPDFIEFGNNVSMQIAAMNPLVLSSELLKEEDKIRQKAIFEVQVKEEGKPENKWEAIISGKMRKYYSEVCLLEMESVLTPKKSIKQLADELSIRLVGESGRVKLISYMRAVVGETVEKEKVIDYGEEIAKMTGIKAEISNDSLLETNAILMSAITNNVDVLKSN